MQNLLAVGCEEAVGDGAGVAHKRLAPTISWSTAAWTIRVQGPQFDQALVPTGEEEAAVVADVGGAQGAGV